MDVPPVDELVGGLAPPALRVAAGALAGVLAAGVLAAGCAADAAAGGLVLLPPLRAVVVALGAGGDGLCAGGECGGGECGGECGGEACGGECGGEWCGGEWWPPPELAAALLLLPPLPAQAFICTVALLHRRQSHMYHNRAGAATSHSMYPPRHHTRPWQAHSRHECTAHRVFMVVVAARCRHRHAERHAAAGRRRPVRRSTCRWAHDVPRLWAAAGDGALAPARDPAACTNATMLICI